jgi:CMP-N-acetylneuraminic acid synthetase
MKSISDITVIIQSRLNSQRVSNKMLRPFANSNLFEIAIQKLITSKVIPKENIYLSIYEDELKNIASKYNLNVYNRSFESANNDNSLQKIYEWHDKLPFKYVIKVNACSPLLKIETIDTFINQFISQEEENLFGVIPIKDYFWNKEGKLITPWPEDQTIMNTKAVEVTYKAAHVLYASRLDLISKNMFMGDFQSEGGIKLYPMNELECFDIDYEWQFDIAELLYKKYNNV